MAQTGVGPSKPELPRGLPLRRATPATHTLVPLWVAPATARTRSRHLAGRKPDGETDTWGTLLLLAPSGTRATCLARRGPGDI